MLDSLSLESNQEKKQQLNLYILRNKSSGCQSRLNTIVQTFLVYILSYTTISDAQNFSPGI